MKLICDTPHLLPLPQQFVHDLRQRIETIEHAYQYTRPKLIAALAEIESIAADESINEVERVNRISKIEDQYGISRPSRTRAVR